MHRPPLAYHLFWQATFNFFRPNDRDRPMTVRDAHNHRSSTVIGLARARPMNMQNLVKTVVTCIHIVDCNLNELTGAARKAAVMCM